MDPALFFHLIDSKYNTRKKWNFDREETQGRLELKISNISEEESSLITKDFLDIDFAKISFVLQLNIGHITILLTNEIKPKEK
jgi:hypothetical protein